MIRNIILALLAAYAACSCALVGSFDESEDKVRSILLTPQTITLPVGGMEAVNVTMTPKGIAGRGVEWEYDKGVIQAQTDGFGAILTGLSQGKTVLRAKAGDKSASCIVEVSGESPYSNVSHPYIYTDTEVAFVSPGESVRVSAALYGGSNADVNGFSFSIDKPSVASLAAEGNYCRINGLSDGAARVTVRHVRASFAYTFLVFCAQDARNVTYITTQENVITMNRAAGERTISVELANAESSAYDSLFEYTVRDEHGNPYSDAPVAVNGAGKKCVITPLREGDCYIGVRHPMALYPLDILARVVENIDGVYIEPSQTIVYVNDTASEMVTLSLVNLPPGAAADPSLYEWRFSEGAEQYIGWTAYGGGAFNRGDSLWVTGKAAGVVKITASHPLAAYGRDIFVMVRDVNAEAARASTYISTGDNFISTYIGADDIKISIYIHDAPAGAERDLAWSVKSEAADGSSGAVISCAAAQTGVGPLRSVRAAVAAAPTAEGFALVRPLKAGRATITVSHPLAAYDTKILVQVSESSAPLVREKVILRAETPLVYVKNGEDAEMSVTLSGGKGAEEEAALLWHAESAAFRVAAAGSHAVLSASGSGAEQSLVRVTHPKADYPLEIPVVRYDTNEELSAFTLLYADNPYYAIYTGESVTIRPSVLRPAPGTALVWKVTEGLNAAVAFENTDNRTAEIRGLAKGRAVITVSLQGTSQTLTFYIHVKEAGVVDEDAPCYLSTADNVVTLAAGGSAEVSVLAVNISEGAYNDIRWTNSAPALLSLQANGPRAAVSAHAGASGSAVLTVSHPLSQNTIEIYIHIGNEYVYKNNDITYISTENDVVRLYTGGPDYFVRAVLAHTENAGLGESGFTFSVRDTNIAAASGASGNGVLLSARNGGKTTLVIRHPDALFEKEVLIIVEREAAMAASKPYLSTASNVLTVIAGEYVSARVNLVNGSGADTAAWNWTARDGVVANVVMASAGEAMLYGSRPGTTYIDVSHTGAANVLGIILIVLDGEAARARPWIKTDKNIVTVRKGGQAAINAEMAGGEAGSGAFFAWSVSNAGLVFLNAAGAGASVKGLAAGMTYVTVRNTKYDEAYAKTILVIVEEAVEDECYINVSEHIVKLKPQDRSGVTIKAALTGGGPLDDKDFVWWADDMSLVGLSSLTSSASVVPLGPSGMTSVHVRHPKALAQADIAVYVSDVDIFAFSIYSKQISAGSFSFVEMRVPPSLQKQTIEYSSDNGAVAAVCGSRAVAMIAGVAPGRAGIKAALKADGKTTATAELAVIVNAAQSAAARLETASSVLTLEAGKSMTIPVTLSGGTAGPADKYDISWTTGDARIVSLLSTEQNVTKGEAAYVTAKSAGETVLTVRHPKAGHDLDIWIIVPAREEKLLILDHTYMHLYKDDGAVAINATITNGVTADYNAISWTAPKSQGQSIVTISKTSGRTCNIIPRAVGQTTVRAQLPDGRYADCVVQVSAAAKVTLAAQTARVNPGYTETISYTVVPENARINWISQGNGGTDAEQFFGYEVNETTKTIAVRGRELGGGTLTGYFVSNAGGATARLNVIVEYNYDFQINGSPLIVREPRPGTTITIPFKVYPPNLEISAEVSDRTKIEVSSISHDKTSGEGSVSLAPLGEKTGLTVTLKATNPNDRVRTPLVRTQQIDLRYDNLTITPVFPGFGAGSFSRWDGKTLYLGTGEDVRFYLDIAEPNGSVSDLKIEWIPQGTVTADNKLRVGTNGWITLDKDQTDTASGKQLWKLGHGNPERDPVSDQYIITKDMYYRLSPSGEEIKADKGKGITGWELVYD